MSKPQEFTKLHNVWNRNMLSVLSPSCFERHHSNSRFFIKNVLIKGHLPLVKSSDNYIAIQNAKSGLSVWKIIQLRSKPTTFTFLQFCAHYLCLKSNLKSAFTQLLKAQGARRQESPNSMLAAHHIMTSSSCGRSGSFGIQNILL